MTVSSSSPSSPRNTSARRPAVGEHPGHDAPPSAGRRTPTAWAAGCAGLVSGPRKLKTVGTPSSRRGTAACRIAGWNTRREAERRCRRVAGTRHRAGDRSTATPSSSSTSAEPQAEDAARLPCLTTRAPAPGDDDRGHRRDVHGVRAVTAGAAGVDRRARDVDPHGHVEHRADQAADLVRGLALGPQRDHEAGDLRRGRLAGHHLGHRPGGVARRSGRRRPAGSPSTSGQVGCRGRARSASRGQRVRTARSAPTAPQQVGDGLGDGDRVERVRHHGVGARPGGQPGVLRRPISTSTGGQWKISSLSCRQTPMPPDGRRLAVEDATSIPPSSSARDHGRLGRALDELDRRQVGGRPPTDREPHLLAGVAVVAVDEHLLGSSSPAAAAVGSSARAVLVGRDRLDRGASLRRCYRPAGCRPARYSRDGWSTLRAGPSDTQELARPVGVTVAPPEPDRHNAVRGDSNGCRNRARSQSRRSTGRTSSASEPSSG